MAPLKYLMPPPESCTKHRTQKPGIYGPSDSIQHDHGMHALMWSLSPMSHSIFHKKLAIIAMCIQKLSTIKGPVWQQAERTIAEFLEKVLSEIVADITLSE